MGDATSLEIRFDPQALPELAAALLMLLLAAWLLYLNFAHRANRVFALLLVLRAGTMGLTTLRDLSTVAAQAAYFERVATYLLLAFVPALVYFAAIYPRRRGWFGTHRSGFWSLVVGGALLELVYFARHDWFGSYRIDAAGTLYLEELGPLFPIVGLVYLAPAALALLFARDYRRAYGGPQQGALLAVCLGFTLNAVHDGTRALLGPFPDGLGPLLVATRVLWGLALLPAVLALALLAHHAASTADPNVRGAVRRFLLIAPFPLVTRILLLGVAQIDADVRFAELLVTGFWRLALPALVTYALVRHRLFDIDVRLKRTLKQSTIAGAFVAVFFVVSEAAQVFFTSRTNSALVGIGAAGLLLFLLAPIQQVAERLASAALPGVRPVGEMKSGERAQIYQEQVRIAWLDGHLTPKDQRLLESARLRLGITAEEAWRLERSVLESSQESSPPSPGRGAAQNP